MQGELMLSDEIAALTHMPREHVRAYITQQGWHRVPPPAGKISRSRYWLRSEVARWESER